MVDEDLIKDIKAKLEDGALSIDDIPQYLDLFVQIANSNDDIKEEVEGWEKALKFEVEDGFTGWLKVSDGTFSAGIGDPEGEVDITFQMGVSIAPGIICAEIDATSAYMAGDLKVVGPLPDAVKFRTIAEMVRESIEDM